VELAYDEGSGEASRLAAAARVCRGKAQTRVGRVITHNPFDRSQRRSVSSSSGRTPTVRGLPRRSSALSVLHSKSSFYGTAVWARRALNSPQRRIPARAVEETVRELRVALNQVRAGMGGRAISDVRVHRIGGALRTTGGAYHRRGCDAMLHAAMMQLRGRCRSGASSRASSRRCRSPSRPTRTRPRRYAQCARSFVQLSPGRDRHFPTKHPGETALHKTAVIYIQTHL
jgi:hypothetical protein